MIRLPPLHPDDLIYKTETHKQGLSLKVSVKHCRMIPRVHPGAGAWLQVLMTSRAKISQPFSTTRHKRGNPVSQLCPATNTWLVLMVLSFGNALYSLVIFTALFRVRPCWEAVNTAARSSLLPDLTSLESLSMTIANFGICPCRCARRAGED